MTTAYQNLAALHDPTSGNDPTVAWGDAINSNMETLAKAPGCIVSRTTAQAIATATTTAIQFNAADIRDTDAFHDVVTNNSRITVPTGLGGIYLLIGQVSMAANATGQRFAGWRVNGATLYRSVATPSAGASATHDMTATHEIPLSAGDYVELVVFQESGGSLNADTARASARLVAWA